MNAIPAHLIRLADPHSEERVRLEAELGARSFRHFFKMAWPYIDPAPYVHSWHYDLLCDEMEAVARRQVRELVVCVPPRTGKSSVLSVCYQAWVWTWFPAAKFITAAYDIKLAMRDSVRTRALVKSEWYQKRWGPASPYRPITNEQGTVIVQGDDNKGLYSTTAGGYRFVCTPGSNVTGWGADFIFCLPGDQLIRTDRGIEPIGQVVRERRAKEVLAFNHDTGRAEMRHILEYETHPGRDLIEIETSDGCVLRCTEDHPVWVRGRDYVRARDLLAGDEVLMCPGAREYGAGLVVAPAHVAALRRLPAPSETYNLSVEGTRNFFAQGILTHNCDDPHPVNKAESEPERAQVQQWWFEAIPTRLNQLDHGVKIVIQQRVHREDLAGLCIARGYRHVVLPMEFDPKHPHRHPKDIRTEPGELLHPKRVGPEALAALKRALGTYGSAGQLQQLPVPREGGLFKRQWFRIVEMAPAEAYANAVRRWDLAATVPAPGKKPDWTAGVLMGKDSIGRIYILHAARFQDTPAQVDTAIKAMASQDGMGVRLVLPLDPGQAGIGRMQAQAAFLAPYAAAFERETGDKATRARGLATMAEAGNVHLVRGSWNEEFLEELCDFPNGSHDDYVDAASGAFSSHYTDHQGLMQFLAQQAMAQDLNALVESQHQTFQVEKVDLGQAPFNS